MHRSIVAFVIVSGLLFGCGEEKADFDRKGQPRANQATDPPARSSSSPADADLLRTAFDESQANQETARSESLKATYVNHYEVHSSAIELIFDFGVVSKDGQNQESRFVVAHRLAMNPLTSKRLLSALEMALARHEQAFGKLVAVDAPNAIPSKRPDNVAYANFCRVMSTPEELILDCGLNPQPYAERPQVEVSHSFVLLHPTAKRFYADLRRAIEQYEKKHGVLELDVRKRVLPGVQ